MRPPSLPPLNPFKSPGRQEIALKDIDTYLIGTVHTFGKSFSTIGTKCHQWTFDTTRRPLIFSVGLSPPNPRSITLPPPPHLLSIHLSIAQFMTKVVQPGNSKILWVDVP